MDGSYAEMSWSIDARTIMKTDGPFGGAVPAAVECIREAVRLAGKPSTVEVRIATGRNGFLAVTVPGSGPSEPAVRRYCSASSGPAASMTVGRTLIVDFIKDGMRWRKSLTAEAAEMSLKEGSGLSMASIVTGEAVDIADATSVTVNRFRTPFTEEDLQALTDGIAALLPEFAGVEVKVNRKLVERRPIHVEGTTNAADFARMEDAISAAFAGFPLGSARKTRKAKPGSASGTRTRRRKRQKLSFRFEAMPSTKEPYILRKGSHVIRLNTRSPFVDGLLNQGVDSPGSMQAFLSLSAQAIAQIQAPRHVSAAYGRKKSASPGEVARAAASAAQKIYAGALNYAWKTLGQNL